MIVAMKKIYMIVQKKDVPLELESLRELGAVHIEPQESLKSLKIDEIRNEVKILTKVISALESASKTPTRKELLDWQEKAEHIVDLLDEAEKIKESLAQRQAIIHQWEPWENFDPKDLKNLEEKGFHSCLCLIPQKEKYEPPEEAILEIISTQGGFHRAILISPEKIEVPFAKISLPKMSLDQMRDLQDKETERLKEIQKEIEKHSSYLTFFQKVLLERQEILFFEEAAEGMKEDQEIASLKGYCPKDCCEQIRQRAEKQHWGLLIEDPSPEDRVPTLLRNPRWVETIKPVFKMIDILPGYSEMDISFFFLLFFSIFFGILIGDAGYGLVFCMMTVFAQKKFGDKIPEKGVFPLMYVLSFCTILWGVLTGTYFGQEWVTPYVKPLIPWLRDNNNVQTLCFFIGATHLTIAHLWRAILKMPSLKFVGEVGWILILWVMFFAARTFVLGADFPQVGVGLLIGGITLILFFTNPNKNPLRAIGAGLGDLALNFVNTFADTVSYIRLFAVGLATVAIADAFNEMALGIGFNQIHTGILSALILVVGHVFNIILGAMSILVHGLRLNVLEFSGHLNMEWAGFKYNPFRKIEKLQ